MKNVFNVKEESIFEFFARNVEGFKEREIKDGMNSHHQSPYHLMVDKIYISKNGMIGIERPGVVEFVLEDRGSGSGRTLLNTYTYKIEEHDDVSLMLRLVDFKVELAEKD